MTIAKVSQQSFVAVCEAKARIRALADEISAIGKVEANQEVARALVRLSTSLHEVVTIHNRDYGSYG